MKLNYEQIGHYLQAPTALDRSLFRFLEMLPAILAWGTLIGGVAFSYFKPSWVAIFIIVFDVYWLLRVVYLSTFLIYSYFKMRRVMETDWMKELEKTGDDWKELYHIIIFPFFNESEDIVRDSVEAVLKTPYPKENLILVLATEARAGEASQNIARHIIQDLHGKVQYATMTTHASSIEGEIAGKGSNETWAMHKLLEEYIGPNGLEIDKGIVSVFDIDTIIHPQYFPRLTHAFVTTENPTRHSYQPVPMFHNNIWDTPALMRVIATSTSFWQLMEQARPERMATFSSHSMSLRAVLDIGFWQTNVVSEDSRVFWQALLQYRGDYAVVPLHFPVSMDANLAPTYLKTMKNQYKQQRRWAWGAENLAFTIWHFLRGKTGVPIIKKLRYSFRLIEGAHSWATNALLIFMLGWLPLVLGGNRFTDTVIAHNLIPTTRILATLAMVGMFVSAWISILLLPKRPPNVKKSILIFMVLQWLLLPITTIAFGAVAALDAQTRLAIKKYMGFWVTEKHRKK